MTTAGARTSVGQLPNFLVIGAMKAGTSSLYQYLRAHPQIFMPAAKELSFFAYEPNARHDLEWYRRQFAPAGEGAVALGEASTMYTKFPRHPGVPGAHRRSDPRREVGIRDQGSRREDPFALRAPEKRWRRTGSDRGGCEA